MKARHQDTQPVIESMYEFLKRQSDLYLEEMLNLLAPSLYITHYK